VLLFALKQPGFLVSRTGHTTRKASSRKSTCGNIHSIWKKFPVLRPLITRKVLCAGEIAAKILKKIVQKTGISIH
jgi:hypothetical protein